MSNSPFHSAPTGLVGLGPSKPRTCRGRLLDDESERRFTASSCSGYFLRLQAQDQGNWGMQEREISIQRTFPQRRRA